MFRHMRWVLMGIGVVALLGGGASIFSRPDYEVLFSPRPPLVSCTKSGCIAMYVLEVGNTGDRVQEHVAVRLDGATIDRALMPLTVRAFGKVPRAAVITEAKGVRTYDLRPLKPGDRVELQFILNADDATTMPTWSQILVGVEAAQGAARPGDAAATSLGRLLYAVFGAG